MIFCLSIIVIRGLCQTDIVYKYQYRPEQRINWLEKIYFVNRTSGDTISTFDINKNNPFINLPYPETSINPDYSPHQFRIYNVSGINLDNIILPQYQKNYLVNPIENKKVWESVVAISNVSCNSIMFTTSWQTPEEKVIGNYKYIAEKNTISFIGIIYNLLVYMPIHNESYLLGKFGDIVILDSLGNIYSKIDNIGLPVENISITRDGHYTLINCSPGDPQSKIGYKTIISSLPNYNPLFEIPYENNYYSIDDLFVCNFCSHGNDSASYQVIDPEKEIKYELLYPIDKACKARERGIFDNKEITFSFKDGNVERYLFKKDFNIIKLTK